MSDQAVLLPKWFSHGGIILAKGQFDHSYPFWTLSILVFISVANLMHHPLHLLCWESNQNENMLWILMTFKVTNTVLLYFQRSYGQILFFGLGNLLKHDLLLDHFNQIIIQNLYHSILIIKWRSKYEINVSFICFSNQF